MKVTPESEAPIIPKATKNQGDCLSPVKKVSDEIFFEVNQEIRNNKKKYDVITTNTKLESIEELGLTVIKLSKIINFAK